MKKTINEYEFVKSFDDYNRSENFTVEARKALFNYLQDYETETGEEMELDVIAICCDFTEYLCLDEYVLDYDEVESIDEIEELTTVIRIDEESFIIQQY